MATKKARSKKSASKAAGSGKSKSQQLLRTPFMADFTKAFIRNSAKEWLWPADGQLRADVATDYQTFQSVLLNRAYVGGPPPSFSTGSLGDRIMQFLSARNWPSATGIPPKFASIQDTVHLIELAVILDRLLEAINAFKVKSDGTGGGGTKWPPH